MLACLMFCHETVEKQNGFINIGGIGLFLAILAVAALVYAFKKSSSSN